MTEPVATFIEHLAGSLENATFIKATLGNYKGADKHLQKVQLRLISTKKGTRLYVLYHFDTRDIAKNFDFADGIKVVEKLFADGFASGHLYTTENDFQLAIGKKGRSRLNVAKPSLKSPPPLEHNRKKRELVDSNSFYLTALGITDDSGRVRDKQQDKWRQINKFVEILASLVDKSELKDRKRLSVVDMGCGKGYLTFAAYDYFKNSRGIEISMTGVDVRDDLTAFCNGIADASGFEGLRFVTGTIDEFEVAGVDVLIALHACNTASDDAIYKGIASHAELIVAAPCCHQELRPQIKPPAMFADILKHGVLLERTAETLTDGLRSLLLEREGYATKMIEFVPVEHTPKNNMLVGTRLKQTADRQRFADEIAQIKDLYGIQKHHLETLLG